MSEAPRFPELAEPYGAALREAVAYVLKRFDPLGIVACGTIIRGAPDRRSDHDLYVFVSEPRRQRIQKWFCGVPAEIFVNPPHAIERYFEEDLAENRPITAHMLAHGFVVLDRDGTAQRLCDLAREYVERTPEWSENSLSGLRYAAATQLEDALDVAETDPETHAMLLAGAVVEALRSPFFARHRRPVPRWKELLASVESLDPEAGRLARRFFRSEDPDERLRLAEHIADRVLEARGFFEWESDPEEV